MWVNLLTSAIFPFYDDLPFRLHFKWFLVIDPTYTY